MTITIQLSETTERKLKELALANGYADVEAYAQSLLEQKVHASEEDVRLEFERLTAQWRSDCRYLSFSERVAQHPAYRKIVAMGERAIPLILAELEAKPVHWFPALHEITGADPVPEGSKGKVREMAAAWLYWGKEHGFRV